MNSRYARKRYKLTTKRILSAIVILFALANLIAAGHAYKLTHFDASAEGRAKAENLSFYAKVTILLTGVSNPRPKNERVPQQAFEKILLQSNKKIACWLISQNQSKGTIIIFHGFGGKKSSMLDQSDEFLKLGYNTLLVDFMGSGESEGNQTTIGFKEAAQVKTCYDYLTARGEQNIYLFGTSMGAVAIMKALNDYKITPKGIIIECPFGSLYDTVVARFGIMKLPSFPMAGLLTLWGGIENGFWAFDHEPKNYAKHINCPTLLLYGEKDERVSRHEIDEIFSNLKGPKTSKTYATAGHENYLTKYSAQWVLDVQHFLMRNR